MAIRQDFGNMTNKILNILCSILPTVAYCKKHTRTVSTRGSRTTSGCGSMQFHVIPEVPVPEVHAVPAVPAVPVLEVGAVPCGSEPIPNPVRNRICS